MKASELNNELKNAVSGLEQISAGLDDVKPGTPGATKRRDEQLARLYTLLDKGPMLFDPQLPTDTTYNLEISKSLDAIKKLVPEIEGKLKRIKLQESSIN